MTPLAEEVFISQ